MSQLRFGWRAAVACRHTFAQLMLSRGGQLRFGWLPSELGHQLIHDTLVARGTHLGEGDGEG